MIKSGRQLSLCVVVLLTFLLARCGKENEAVLSGKYKGQFVREMPGMIRPASMVEIEFTGNKFLGVSAAAKYPAICEGYYNIIADSINFSNTCPWTADFDWTLILDGKFHYRKTGDSLIISRAAGTGMDIYRMRKN